MNRKKWTGRLLIVTSLVLWTFFAMSVEPRGRRDSDVRAGKLSLVVVGLIVAWSRWRQLDLETDAEQRRRDLDSDTFLGDDPETSAAAGTRLPLGTRVDLGPCPACAGGPTVITASPAGLVQVRCRQCGLIGTPPELQPAARN